MTTHNNWGQLWTPLASAAQKSKKIRDLSKNTAWDNLWLFFDQTREKRALRGLQEMANTLSTETPTDFGGNFSAPVENTTGCGKTGTCSSSFNRNGLLSVF